MKSPGIPITAAPLIAIILTVIIKGTFPGRGAGKQLDQFPLVPQNFRVPECDAHADNIAGNKRKADITQRRPGQGAKGAFQIALMLPDQGHNHTDSQQHRYADPRSVRATWVSIKLAATIRPSKINNTNKDKCTRPRSCFLCFQAVAYWLPVGDLPVRWADAETDC